MSEYKLVPVEPADEMISAAEDAYMPFGDMEMAIRMAVLAAPAVQGEPDRARLRERFDEIEREIMENKHTASSVFTQMRTAVLYTAPQPAEQQPCPEDIREGAPYDDPDFESLCREHEIWGTAASAQCAVFWEAGKRVAEQRAATDAAALVEALEQCITSMLDSGYRANALVIRAARAALAAHRKQGGGK